MQFRPTVHVVAGRVPRPRRRRSDPRELSARAVPAALTSTTPLRSKKGRHVSGCRWPLRRWRLIVSRARSGATSLQYGEGPPSAAPGWCRRCACGSLRTVTTRRSSGIFGRTVSWESRSRANRSTTRINRRGTSIFVKALGLVVAIFFSIAGAMIGAMITMYSSIANRSREIGTRCAHLDSSAAMQILTSFLTESVALALLGGFFRRGGIATDGLREDPDLELRELERDCVRVLTNAEDHCLRHRVRGGDGSAGRAVPGRPCSACQGSGRIARVENRRGVRSRPLPRHTRGSPLLPPSGASGGSVFRYYLWDREVMHG